MSRRLSPAERALIDARVARDAARAALLGTVARLRPEASPARIAARIKADVTWTARRAAIEAIDIAADERGIVAGTAAALLAWVARRQIAAGAAGLWHRLTRHRPEPTEDDA